VDRQQARDVTHWRKAERARLVALRLATSPEERRRTAEAVAAALDRRVDPGPGMTVSLYRPFRGELDLRGWMARTPERGAKARPLTRTAA
jgi:5-formyltetrahydrofolate cyclo-ligase